MKNVGIRGNISWFAHKSVLQNAFLSKWPNMPCTVCNKPQPIYQNRGLRATTVGFPQPAHAFLRCTTLMHLFVVAFCRYSELGACWANFPRRPFCRTVFVEKAGKRGLNYMFTQKAFCRTLFVEKVGKRGQNSRFTHKSILQNSFLSSRPNMPCAVSNKVQPICQNRGTGRLCTQLPERPTTIAHLQQTLPPNTAPVI